MDIAASASLISPIMSHALSLEGLTIRYDKSELLVLNQQKLPGEEE